MINGIALKIMKEQTSLNIWNIFGRTHEVK